MNKVNKNKLSMIFALISLCLILIPMSANAELSINKYSTSTDFNAYLPQSMDVCVCGDTASQITIQNTGAYQTSFTIISSDEDLFSVAGTDFIIESGSQLSIPYTISADCNFKNKEIDVTIRNALNVEKEFQVNIQGKNCQNLAAMVTYTPQVLTPCIPVNFELEVRNIGSFADTYYFDLGEFSEYALSEHGSVTLQPNQIGYFNVTLKLPCEFYGNYTIPVNFYTVGTKRAASFANEIEILRKYDFSTDLSSEIFACSEDRSVHTFNIINNEKFNNTFKIKSLYPDFVTVKTKELVIPGNSQAQVEFIVSGSKKRIGYHNLGLVITSDLGNIEKQVNTSINMGVCYDIDISSEYDSYDYCGRETGDVPLIIQNNAAIKQDVKLDVTEWGGTFVLSNYSFELEPGQAKTVMIDLSNVSDMNKFYKIPISASVEGRENCFRKVITFDFKSSSDCHKTIIDPSKIKINYDANETWFKVINFGAKQFDYSVFIIPVNPNASAWIELSDYHTFSLDPYQEEWINVIFNENISLAEKGDYKFNITIIPTNSIENVNSDYVFTVVLRDKSFFYYAGVWIISNPITVIGIIVLLLLLLLLLYLCASRPKNLEKKKKRKKTSKKLLFILIGLALLFLILLLIFCPLRSIYPALDNSDNFNLSMYSGDTKMIEMSNYFEDPDNDELSYFVKLKTAGNDTVLNFSVTFDDSKALITAGEGTSGVIPFWFYASDSDYFVKSDMFLLKVVEKPVFTFNDYINFYICYIIWLVVVIIFAIYVIALFVWSNKKTERQHKNNKKV